MFTDVFWIVYNVIVISYTINLLVLFSTNLYNFLKSSPGFIRFYKI